MNAKEEADLLMHLITFVCMKGSVNTAELAAFLKTDEKRVLQILKRANYCGKPYFDPSDLIEVEVDGNSIRLKNMAGVLDRPRALNMVDLITIYITFMLFSETLDSDPFLCEAMSKVLSALEGKALFDVERFEEGIEIEENPRMKRRISIIDEAIREQRSLVIEYFTKGSEEFGVRLVDPITVKKERNWILEAWCHKRKRKLHFRIDRILKASIADEVFKTDHSKKEQGEVKAQGYSYNVEMIVDREAAIVLAEEGFDISESGKDDSGNAVFCANIRTDYLDWIATVLISAGLDKVYRIEPAAILDVMEKKLC